MTAFFWIGVKMSDPKDMQQITEPPDDLSEIFAESEVPLFYVWLEEAAEEGLIDLAANEPLIPEDDDYGKPGQILKQKSKKRVGIAYPTVFGIHEAVVDYVFDDPVTVAWLFRLLDLGIIQLGINDYSLFAAVVPKKRIKITKGLEAWSRINRPELISFVVNEYMVEGPNGVYCGTLHDGGILTCDFPDHSEMPCTIREKCIKIRPLGGNLYIRDAWW